MAPGGADGLSASKRALLEQRRRGTAAVPSPPRPLPRRTGSGPAPLSLAQEQLWYFSRLAPDNPVYNEAVTIRKDGRLDVGALRAALDEIVRRHEIWRSVFTVVDGEPVQVVRPAPSFALPVVDLAGFPPDQREGEAARQAAEQAKRPYDLERGPLVRPLLVRFTAEHHRLYLALHHLVFDGVSLYRIILPELVALYDAFSAGRAPSLPEPAIQYADYALAAREWAAGPEFGRRIDHWRRRLDGAPPLRLPLDHPRPPRPRFKGAMQRLRIPRELTEQLRALSRASGASLFQVLCTAFAVLLHRYTGEDDVLFGTLADMRDRAELEGMVGYCLTPLVVRADVRGDPSFSDLLGRVRGDLLDGISNLVPFERLVRELHPRRDPGANPIFQAALVLEPPGVPTDPDWSLHQIDTEVGNAVGNAKFDLHLELDERVEGHVDGRLIYNVDVFEPPTVARIAGHWARLLEGIVAAPGAPVSELPLLSDAERHRQLVEWNATAADYPRGGCVHELVAAQAKRTPNAVAVVFGDEQLSYAQLERRANRVAERVLASRPGAQLVAICVERSLDMVVGMLGILKAGAAYLPLDPHHPPDRLAFMLEDSGATLLLTQRPLLAALPLGGADVICLDEASPADGSDHAPAASVGAEGLAYVLYTSGSTGRPKGVCVPHRALVNLLTSMARRPGMGPTDTIVAITTYGFDIAAVELWLPLVTGARTVIASREVSGDGRRLAALVAATGTTVLQATPATWQMLVDTGWGGLPGLVALCGGEALTPALAEALLDRAAAVWNVYGPTETTVWSTMARVERGDPVTVGRPIANTRVYILDRTRQPVAVGVGGELAIAGDGVALGYLRRPDLTAERFVADPFVPGARMYLTGDLARHLPDGRVEHLGRLDDQVKIRGFRVEPGEVEAALLAQPDVAAAVVVAREQAPGDTRLVAYLVPRGRPPDPLELRRRLRATLPEPMVPSSLVALDALPLTANGKVDRSALPAPPRSGGGTATPVAARSALEERIAAIWARVLGVDRPGVDDDFFDAGGHSLLAVRLLVEVERDLGTEVPLAAFLGGSVTIAGLAASLEARPGTTPGSRLVVPLQAQGTAPILFFVHADESSMLTLRHFTAPLGPDQRVVGLLPERIGRRFDRSRSIESLARPMLDTIRDAQPQGPYFIAGYSLGGLLAYEIAGRLRADGDEVAWLGILDAATPAGGARYQRERLSLRQRLARQRQRGPRGAWRKTEEVVARELRALLVRLDARRSAIGGDFDWRGAAVIGMRYSCPGHDAPMDLFVTDDRVAGAGSDALGWEDVHLGVLRVHRVDGTHLAMVTEPHVSVLAEMVSRSLYEARRSPAAS